MLAKEEIRDFGQDKFNEIIQFFPEGLKKILSKAVKLNLNTLEEIRLRADKPLMLYHSMKDWFVETDGNTALKTDKPYIVKQQEIQSAFALMCENSIYAYQDEIRNGYVTLKGGHRVGITGRVVLDGTKVKNMKDISGLNIRLAREIKGCAQKLVKFILDNRYQVLNTLLVSPPQCGKTTILRDLARLLSNGISTLGFEGVKVGIVDERSEIAACFRGCPQNNVGLRTDVLDGCPKAIGMPMLIRSMSPQVIITDEIGDDGDGEAVLKVINAGVKIITSAHGYSISELKTRREVLRMMDEGVFERYIVLGNSKGPGTVREIIDGKTMKVIYKEE